MRAISMKYGLELLWIAACVCVMGTVFVVWGGMKDEVITAKYFWFFSAQTVFCSLTFLNVLIRRQKISFCGADIFVLIFVLYCSANYLIKESAFEIKLVLILFLGAFYISLRILLSFSRIATDILYPAILIIGFAQSALGLMQLYGFSGSYHHLYNVSGDFFNPGPFSGFVALSFPLAVYFLIEYYPKAKQRKEEICSSIKSSGLDAKKILSIVFDRANAKILLSVVSGLNVISTLLIIPSAMSRSAWLAIAISVLVVMSIKYDWLSRIKIFFHSGRTKFFSVALIIIIMCCGVLYGMIKLKEASVTGRLFVWKTSMSVIAERPLTGSGLGNFSGVYGQAQHDFFAGTDVAHDVVMTADCPAYAFNEFVQIAIEQGLVGLVLFLVAVGLAIKYCIYDRKKLGILGALVSVLVFSMGSYPFSVLPICIMFVVLLALAAKDSKRLVSPILLIVISGLVAGGCLFFSITHQSSLKSSYKTWRSISLVKSSKYNDMTKEYEKLYPHLGRYHSFMFEYGQGLSVLGRYEQSNQILFEGRKRSSDPMFANLIGNNYFALGDLQKAEHYYLIAYHTLPNRLYPLYLLCKMYNESSQEQKAKDMAAKLLDKEPKVMSTAVKQMKVYAKEVLTQ